MIMFTSALVAFDDSSSFMAFECCYYLDIGGGVQ